MARRPSPLDWSGYLKPLNFIRREPGPIAQFSTLAPTHTDRADVGHFFLRVLKTRPGAPVGVHPSSVDG